MEHVSINYKFSQRFDVPVDEAFAWSIDYEPGPADLKRMGERGSRKIRKLNDDTIILDDVGLTEKGQVTKRRLVRINHERRAFVNTHIGGPTPHSQFWYEFFARDDGGSRLEFTGMLLLPAKKKMTKSEVASRAEKERATDSKAWQNLAKAMEAELR